MVDNLLPERLQLLVGLCDYGVTPVPTGLVFGFGTALGLGLRGLDLGVGLDMTILQHAPGFLLTIQVKDFLDVLKISLFENYFF